MDAAEHLFISRGYRSTTMDDIARDAGYSRSAIYRHFPNRRDLLAAMVQRTTQRHMSSLSERLSADVGLLEMLVESLVIVATELVHDPLLMTLADQSPDGTMASLIANDSGLVELVESVAESMLAEDTTGQFRAGLHPRDLGQFFISTALSLLLEVVPGTSDAAVARRYIQTFVLPAIVADPPPAERVFSVRRSNAKTSEIG